MPHYAELNEDNIVTRVVVVAEEHDTTEIEGVLWCRQFFGGGRWLKTSYNRNIRKNFAGPGHVYDAQRDAFIPPKPCETAVLLEDTCQWFVPEAMGNE